MSEDSAFGVPIEQLRDTASRHGEALAMSEAVILGPLAHDGLVSPELMMAFIKYRAAGQLIAAVGGNVEDFIRDLIEARRMALAGLL